VTSQASARPRSLTETLRTLDADSLAVALARRPDLLTPAPRDLTDLATRASSPASTVRALDALDAWQRDVCEALAALPDPSTLPDLAQLLHSDIEVVATAVDELRRRLLVWGDDDALHLVRAAREHFEPYPAGLAPPSSRPLPDAVIESSLAACGDTVRPVLDRLLWSPTGAVRNADRPVTVETARSPVELLLAHQLLRPMNADTVVLPREVALHLRGHRLFPVPASPTPPEVTGRSRTPALVDKAAAGAAFGLLHDVDLVVLAMEAAPHRLLRAGGLATRDVAALARSLGTDPAHAGFVVECAAAAGLVAAGAGLRLLPTSVYDRWVAFDAARRWRDLAEAWLGVPRHIGLATEPGAHVLGPEADAQTAPVLREQLLQLLTTCGRGCVPDLAELEAALAWRRPRLTRIGSNLATVLAWTWREAAWLGLTALGAVSSYSEVLPDPSSPMPARLADLFPAPVHTVVIQSDLTAVAAGPLEPAIAADLRLLADQESRGGGGVFRFSATSLRRGFDAGWSAQQIGDWLSQHSTTGVPQPLAYLIDDLARQYGSIRVGPALSYVRTLDDAQAAALLAHPDATLLQLRSVAPGLLVSSADPYDVVEFLRGLGHTPSAEDESGRAVTTPARMRAPAPPRRDSAAGSSAAEVGREILAGEHHARRSQSPAVTESTLSTLQRAVREGRDVTVAYVGADGVSTVREVRPVQVQAGVLQARARDTSRELSIALSRISDVIDGAERHLE
jgi:hypothetical protein